MKRVKLIILISFFALAISACNLPGNLAMATVQATSAVVINTVSPVGTAVVPTVVSTAVNLPLPTSAPNNFPTLIPSADVPAVEPTIPPTSAPAAGGVGCTNNAEFVADISIPDGAILNSEIGFVKTWRVKNSGTCTWDNRYSLIFVDGTLLMPSNQVPLPGTVAPGQTIDLSLNMTAPIYPGNYESDWKLRSPSGTLFGVGKKDTPLWVKIVISSPDTTNVMGYVYQDRNGNDIYDQDDILMANREVWLLVGSCEQGGSPLVSTYSDSNGRYVVSAFFSGTHCVGLKGPNGLEDTSMVSVALGQTLTNVDLRAAVPSTVISGWVWNDSLQPDGIPQNSESYIAGVVVSLAKGACGTPMSVPVAAITDPQGYFFFRDLYGGTYCVSIDAGEGNNASIFMTGNWTSPVNGIQQVTVNSGQEGTANFGWQYK
jgi:hypothetical protein